MHYKSKCNESDLEKMRKINVGQLVKIKHNEMFWFASFTMDGKAVPTKKNSIFLILERPKVRKFMDTYVSSVKVLCEEKVIVLYDCKVNEKIEEVFEPLGNLFTIDAGEKK